MAADVPARTVSRRQFIAGVCSVPLVGGLPAQISRDDVLADDAGRGLRDERNDRLEDENSP